MNRRTRPLIPVAIAALLLLLPFSTPAQEAPGPLAEMWIVTPKEGHSTQFVASLKEHIALRSEQDDPRQWEVYTPLLGDELGRFAIRACCFNWADLDAYTAWDESKTGVYAHFNEKVAPLVDKAEHYFDEIDWTSSHWNDGSYRYFSITEFMPRAGHANQFKGARVKLSQIAIDQGWASDERSWLWLSRIGGKPSVSLVVPHENYADMAGGDEAFFQFLASKLGSSEEAMKLMQEFSGSSWGSKYQLWEHHPDLSMQAAD
ncbi:MAG: hypothetical protein RQ826_11630 [Xanthomonadales bacterium]|nr:hypothetical protein [Xanthomonadales bacterium]